MKPTFHLIGSMVETRAVPSYGSTAFNLMYSPRLEREHAQARHVAQLGGQRPGEIRESQLQLLQRGGQGRRAQTGG